MSAVVPWEASGCIGWRTVTGWRAVGSVRPMGGLSRTRGTDTGIPAVSAFGSRRWSGIVSERTYQPHLLADLLEQQQARLIARAVDDATADLQAECARLARDLENMTGVRDHWYRSAMRAIARWRRALRWAWGYRRERDVARAALAKYGAHHVSCAYWGELTSAGLRPACTCELSAALDTAPQPRGACSAPLEGER